MQNAGEFEFAHDASASFAIEPSKGTVLLFSNNPERSCINQPGRLF